MTDKPTLIITGANGYLGKYLLDYFLLKQWTVKAFVHKMPEVKLPDVTYIPYDMKDIVDSNDFENIDFLIHAAYMRYEKDSQADIINIEGTKKLINICNEKNIKIAFLSSFSAHTAAVSHYGITKLKCEELFDLKKDVVLKIGFIIGPKGILSEMITRMRSSSIFPLVGGGNQPLQSVYSKDLCEVVDRVLVMDRLTGIFCIAHNEIVTMKVFYKELAIQLRQKLTFIPVPTSLLYALCKFFENLRIKIPISSESVLGLKKLTTFDTQQDQKLIGVQFKDFRESLHLVVNKI